MCLSRFVLDSADRDSGRSKARLELCDQRILPGRAEGYARYVRVQGFAKHRPGKSLSNIENSTNVRYNRDYLTPAPLRTAEGERRQAGCCCEAREGESLP